MSDTIKAIPAKYLDSRAESASVALGGIIVAAVVGILAWGFVPGSTTLFCLLRPGTQDRFFCELAGFPVLAFLFSLSAPTTSPNELSERFSKLAKLSAAPIALALFFGMIQQRTPLIIQLDDSRNHWLFLWNVLSVPLAEELIFRKWLFGWLERWFGKKVWPDTNPLPVTVWLSALGFAIWHFQNWATGGNSQVLLQVGYTFFAGLWLGMLRYRGGHWRYPFLAHVAMNLVY